MELGGPLPGQLPSYVDVHALEAESYLRWDGPKTLEQVLARASARMDAEDAAELAYAQWMRGGPVRAMKHPRRRLRRLLRAR